MINILNKTFSILVLAESICSIKNQDKIIEKTFELKAKKSPIDEFSNLPADDIEFLKQVDKQFKAHGEKIQIRIERGNDTAKNKNSKRTIDGILGYGLHHEQNQNGYHFSQPHFMHQFTSHDSSYGKENTREKATDIEIQQSHSFELKQADYPRRYHESLQTYHKDQAFENPVPVIVLRIPGPQKYALHLQALLQQYLEIRAAHYIKTLEEDERQGQLMHPQQYIVQQHQHLQLYQMVPMFQNQQHQPNYYYQNNPQVQLYSHHQAGLIPVGEQSYYSYDRGLQDKSHQTHQSLPTQFVTQPPVFSTSYGNFVTPVYNQDQAHNQDYNDHQIDDSEQIVENYPSDKHTHVRFKKKNLFHSPAYSLHRSKPIVVLADTPGQEEDDRHQIKSEPSEHNSYDYDNNLGYNPSNYHSLHSILGPNSQELHKRNVPKRMATLSTRQYNDNVSRLIASKSKRIRKTNMTRNDKVKVETS